MQALWSGQGGLEKINGLIMPVTTESIVAYDVFDAFCGDCKRFYVKSTARNCFEHSLHFFSVSYGAVATSNVKYSEEVRNT